MATIKAGTEFRDPNGRLYCTAARDIEAGHPFPQRSQFVWPDGRVPEPGTPVPGWFVKDLLQYGRIAVPR